MDPEALIKLIQFEQTNLERDHVYYSVDEQPEICARLIAQGLRGSKSSENIKDDIADGLDQIQGQIGQKLREAMEPIAQEFVHRVSVTVQGWHDVPAAIRLIRERQREFKKGMGL